MARTETSADERRRIRATQQARYDKANTKLYQIKLNRNTDADLMSYLESLPNRQGHIKELLRREMERTGWEAPANEEETPEE